MQILTGLIINWPVFKVEPITHDSSIYEINKTVFDGNSFSVFFLIAF